MDNLFLRFAIDLGECGTAGGPSYHGPVFHRWLPDGERDAIPLITGRVDAELVVWFERWGYRDGDFITFDRRRKEVDLAVMRKQAILDAGPLIGLLRMRVSRDEMAALKQSKVGDKSRMELARKAVRLIQTPVARFVDTLRTTYGQYWLPEVRRWDSLRQTLGHYFNWPLNSEWSLDHRKTWASFEPETLSITLRLPRRPEFGEYLTAADWKTLARTAREDQSPSLSSFLIARARLTLKQGELKYALVEAVSALEVALDEFVRRRVNKNRELTKSMEAFHALNLRARVTAIVTTLGTISESDMELAVRGIDARNKVVHEGWDPPEGDEEKIDALLRTASSLQSGPTFKFPTVWYGNEVKSPKEWNKYYRPRVKAKIGQAPQGDVKPPE